MVQNVSLIIDQKVLKEDRDGARNDVTMFQKRGGSSITTVVWSKVSADRLMGTVNSAVVSSVFEVRPRNHLYEKPLPPCALNQENQQKRWFFEPSVNSPVTAGQLKFEP